MSFLSDQLNSFKDEIMRTKTSEITIELSIDIWQKLGYFNGVNKEEIARYIFDELWSNSYVDYGERNNPFVQSALDLFRIIISETDNRKTWGLGSKNPISKITDISEDDFYKIIQQARSQIEDFSMDSTIKIIMIGCVSFMLAAPAYTLLLRKNQGKNRRNKKHNLPKEIIRYSLVIIVPSIDFERDFEEEFFDGHFNKLSLEQCKKIYSLRKFLWTGTENEANDLGFNNLLQGGLSSSKSESEYDIRLIKIILKNEEDGFNQGVTNRLPAFKRLVNNIEKGYISPPLEPIRYGNFPLYY
jgi:hypothetical protein